MLIFNILWHITQHSFSRGLSSSQMKRKLCKHFSKMSLFTAQYFKFNFCAPIFQFPLEQQIGGAFCRRALSKTSAENFRQCSPTLDSTYHLQTHFHRLEKWSNQRWKKLGRSRIWEDEKVQSVRKGVDGHGLERKRSRNEMDHWWHTSLSARPHNHYTNTQSPNKQTQTQKKQRQTRPHKYFSIKSIFRSKKIIGINYATNNQKQFLPFLSHVCWESVCLFLYLCICVFICVYVLYICLFVYLYICVFVYFD